jgi:GTP:adenosylcobinamide-phosphate guanylyltransferase
MRLVLPMTGLGSRFVQAGYTELKPFIVVDGKPMIQHVRELFPTVPNEHVHCIMRKEHAVRDRIESMWEGVKVHEIDGHSLGPVYAVAPV